MIYKKNLPDTWGSIRWKLFWRRGRFCQKIISFSFYSSFQVATLAQDLLESVQWSDAIEAADSPRIFPVGWKTFLEIWSIFWYQIPNPTFSGQRLWGYGWIHCSIQWILFGMITVVSFKFVIFSSDCLSRQRHKSFKKNISDLTRNGGHGAENT